LGVGFDGAPEPPGEFESSATAAVSIVTPTEHGIPLDGVRINISFAVIGETDL
jgi:hypothetical protein